METQNEKSTQHGNNKVIIDMGISLDGFVADQTGRSVYPINELQNTEALNELVRTTGAVVMGRNAYDMAEGDFSGYEYQVPIFVLTHEPPKEVTKGQNDKLKINFVSDGIESAIAKAKAAAGEKKNVTLIGGANAAQQCIKAGLADEIRIRVMPQILRQGLPMFNHLGKDHLFLKMASAKDFSTRVDIKLHFENNLGNKRGNTDAEAGQHRQRYHQEENSSVVAGMTISLDGFINDRKGSVELLYPDMQAIRHLHIVQEAMKTTGAVVMGRKSYDMANGDFTEYEFQAPIFVVTHHAPEVVAKGENDKLKFHFITDGVESAVRQAKVVAGKKNVQIIGGASVFQQAFNAGLIDELQLGIAPVILNGGTSFFEHLTTPEVKLDVTGVIPSADRLDVIFNVPKEIKKTKPYHEAVLQHE